MPYGQFYLTSDGALEPKSGLCGSGFVSVCERGDPERGFLTDGDTVMLCLWKSMTGTYWEISGFAVSSDSPEYDVVVVDAFECCWWLFSFARMQCNGESWCRETHSDVEYAPVLLPLLRRRLYRGLPR
jgi:hypothetical protein